MATLGFLTERSLARRLLIAAGVWCLVVLVGGAFALSALYRAQTIQLLEEELDASLVALSRAVDQTPEGELTARENELPADPRYETPLTGRYWAILSVDAEGLPQRDLRSTSLWDGDVPLPDGLRRAALADPGTAVFGDAEGPDAERLRVGARAIVLGETGLRAVLLAAADREKPDEGARRFLFLLLGAMIALAGGVLIAMAVQVRVVLAPLSRVREHVSDVREGRRTHLDSTYPEEVRPLTEELNKLLEHNRAVVDRARTHVGNLAHALKTPLAVLRNEAVGDSELDRVVQRQTEQMRTNVDHYLKRAQAAARAQTLGARTEVKPVLEGLARLLERLFEDRGIRIVATSGPRDIFRGEQQDLEEMLGNLMENACKWATHRVEVAVTRSREGRLRIHVDDDGPGLAPEARRAALTRGVRLDETAPGSGLGLSIVQEVAELYSGELSLATAPLGGLRATLELPAA